MAAGQGDPQPPIDSKTDFIKIIYTSGATGIPKGAPYTHYQAIRGGFVYSEALNPPRMISFWPLFLSIILMPLFVS